MGSAASQEPESPQVFRPRLKRSAARIYQIKITLAGIYPEIWRRLLVSSEIRLSTLHKILQASMGWTDSHLHEFVAGERHYSDPRDGDPDCEPDSGARLSDVAPWTGDRFSYLYDFGDNWMHEILVENILPPDPAFECPVCLSGEGACPPEDCGGAAGYSTLVHSLHDPKHEDHEANRRIVGIRYDADAFDPKAANRLLKRFRRSPKGRVPAKHSVGSPS